MNRAQKRREARQERRLAAMEKLEKPEKLSGCAARQPTIRCRVHTPEVRPIHPHLDSTFEVKAASDWEAWAKTSHKLIEALGCAHNPLIIGFILDLIGLLPVPAKRLIAAGIIAGFGCQVTEEEDGSVFVEQVPRYPPCFEPKEHPSGLVIPDSGEGLVLPGMSDFSLSKEPA